MRKTLGRTTLVAALALAGAAVAVPGAAGADQHDTRGAAMSLYPPSALVLTVAPGTGDDGQSVQRAVTLSCAPTPSGTHPAAKGACAELKHNQGDFAAITAGPPLGVVCTKEWRPITVTADGVWDGQRVSYRYTFGNPCIKQAGQGIVFDF